MKCPVCERTMRLGADGWWTCADCGALLRPSAETTGPRTIIWSETRMLWWRRARQDRGIDGDGYTDHVIWAGLWTREEAERIKARRGAEVTLVDVSAEECATLEATRVLPAAGRCVVSDAVKAGLALVVLAAAAWSWAVVLG